MLFSDYVYYDESSESKLRWRISTRNGKKKVGDAAGWKGSDGYWYVQINEKTYKAHRIIATLFGASLTAEYVVDHINMNNSDNTASNLRVVLREVNLRNTKQYKNNTSGVKGVKYDARTNCWRAFWRGLDGKCHTKSFFVPRYGDEAKHLAIAYRIRKIIELNEAGAGYTDNHQCPTQQGEKL